MTVKGGGNTEDKEIIKMLTDKDSAAAESLLHQYSHLFYYIVSPVIKDERDREECISDIIIKVSEKISSYDETKGSFTAWLTAVARNTALNRLRTNKRLNEIQPDENMPSYEPGPEELFIKKEQLNIIKNALGKLKSKDRVLFYRKYYYCQSTAQIASETGLSVRAVEGRLYRIKKKLKKLTEATDYE